MKKMKKLLSALLAVAMLMSMVLPVSAEGIAVRVSDFELLEATPAEEIVDPAPEVEIEEVTVEAEVAEASEASAQTITVDVPFSVSVAYDEYADFLFTPAESGRYILHGVYGERLMTDVEVADNGNGVACDHWDHNDTNETGHSVTLNAGTTYKIRLNNWSDMSQINTTLTLTKATNYETFRLEQESTVAYVGGQANFYVKGTPIFAGEEITWTVSDESILPHFYGEGAWGNAECAAVGIVTVTATTASGLSDSCTITVKEAEAITGDSFDVTLDAGGYAEYQFTPAEDGSYLFYYPSRSHSIGFELWDKETGRFQYSTSWQNADNSLRGNYFNLTGGMKYRVRVNNWWGDQAQSCTIGVTKLAPFDSIWFNGNATCYVGSEVHVTVAGSPEFSAGNISWSISDTSIVSENFADNSGITLNGLSAGTATVTATTDSGLSASFEVTVVDMPTITGNSFDVSLPANGEQAFLYTPAEDGTYLFYFDRNTWNIGFTVYKYDDNEWIDRGDWANSQTGDHGNAFALTGGTTYRIVVDNHDSRDRFETVSIAKAVPYDNMWIEGNGVCYVGDWAYLNLRGTPDFAMEPAQWTVSNPNVVEVRYTGATAIDLIGLSVGTTTVTATTASGKTATFELTVKEKEAISLGQTVDIFLKPQESAAFTFTPAETARYIFYRPGDNGFNTEIRTQNGRYMEVTQWFDSNVEFWGNAADLTAGETYTITANNWNDRNVNSTLTVVKAEPVTALSFEQDTYKVYVGNYQDLHLTIEPYFGCEKVSYTTSDSDVAFIEGEDAMGVGLSFGKVGTATITATTASGLTAKCTVNAIEMPSLSLGTQNVDIPAGEYIQVNFTAPESGAYILYRAVNSNFGLYFRNMPASEWHSDDDSYFGQVVEMTAGETAAIQLENWYNYDQTVTIAIAKAVPYEHIAFRSAPMGFVGEETYVQITGGPGFAYNPIQWSSSNPSVASITWGSGTGANFMCHAVGTTTITATTSNGLSVSYEMKVTEMPTLKVGETVLLEIPFEGHTQVLFTPEADGTYIFHYPANGYFGVQCRDENHNWPNGFEWNNSDDTRRGTGFALLRGVTYTLEVYNWNVQGIAELELTATKAVPYTKLGFAQDSYTGYVSTFQTVPLLLDYAPEYGGEELIVKSSNENVVVPGWVSGDYIYLNPVATGTATVTISTVDGRLKDTCTVTIKEPIAITSGKEQSMTIESAGYALFKFTPTTSATYAFYCMDNENFGFSVHDENGNWIETEDRWANNALIAQWEAVAGKTYYIPFNNHGEAKNTFKIGVGQSTKATSMTIPAQDFDLYPHLYFYLQPVFAPVLGETEAVTWTSSNEKVAKFNKTYEYDGGYVDYEFYAAGAGTATITATSESGMKASVKITVKTPGKINTGSHSVKLPEWELITYQFTAPETGNYVISDETADCTVGWIMANEAEEIFVEGNNQAPVKVYLEKGQTVYPVVSNNTEEEMTFKFTIEQGTHEHEIKLVEAKDATYAEPGNIAHYACICGKLYADAEGKTELTAEDVIIPVLEGAMTLVNEETKAVTIAAGEEVVYLFTAEKTGTYSFVTDRRIGWNLAVETADGQPVAITERPAAADLSGAYQLFGFDISMTAGDTYILKVSHDMEWEESFEFAIGQFAAATSMKLDKSEVTVYPYEQFALNPDFGSIFAIAEDVIFTSSNPAIVEFNPNYEEETGLAGYGFKPLKPGKVTITATSENGLKATCTVAVKTPASIGLGEHTTPVLNDGDSIAYYFTPEVSGKYDLYLTSEMDFVLSWSSLKENERELWKGPEYVGFRAYLEAGETYTVYVKNFYMQGSKTFTFWLSEAHEHAIKPVEAKAPTYTEDGYEAHFACDCGMLFADAEGTVEIEMDSIRIPMLIQISEGKAEVPKEVIDDFVAEVEQGGEVSIPVAEAGTNSKEEVKSTALPVESLTQIAEKEATLTVEMPTATVTMDTAVLAAVVEKAGENATVTLEVAEVAEEELTESQVAVIEQLEKKPAMTISAELLVNDQPIASKENGGFGENAKVTVKIPVGPGKADYTVLYIADDGTVENIPAVFENGFLILELEHFSDYAIIKNTVPGDVNDDGDINVLDLMYLANYFAKGETINKANADVNADGTLNVLDLMYLANFFAGKETTLG